MSLVHEFQQARGAPIRICSAFIFGGLCGKWPNHHLHTGATSTCLCDDCRTTDPVKRLVARLTAAIDETARTNSVGPPPVGYVVDGRAYNPGDVQLVYAGGPNTLPLSKLCTALKGIVDLCKRPLIDVSAVHERPGTQLVEGEGPPWALPVLNKLAEGYGIPTEEAL